MKTPKYLFLLPGTTGRWWSGGTDTFLRLARLIGEHRQTEVVVYAGAEAGHRQLEEVLPEDASAPHVWVFTTGVDVPTLKERLAGRRMVYCAQEFGWRLDLPLAVPIVCTSRAVMAAMAQQMGGHPVYLLPNALRGDVENRGLARDIDVLYLTRKTTPYLRDELVPALRERCRVETLDRFVPRDDLLSLYNRSRLYLYDSSSSFADGVVEGFGIQPLEALVCGCVVVSNLAGGMTDYLEPGLNCHRLRLTLKEDVELCLGAVRGESRVTGNGEELRRRHSEEALRLRLERLLPEIEQLSVPRDEETAGEIARHVSGARREAVQPLYSEILQQRRLIEALQAELQAKVEDRDTTIRTLQAELLEKIGERDSVIGGLQSELHTKVGERDALIRGLQAELHAKVEERDAMIAGLQNALATRGNEHESLVHALRTEAQQTSTGQQEALDALRRDLDSLLNSKSWRWTAPLRGVSRYLRGARRRQD